MFSNRHLEITTNVPDGVRASVGRPAPAIDALAERFGAGRLMWGSNFCQTHDRPYWARVERARERFAERSGSHRAKWLGGAAHRLWGGATEVGSLRGGLEYLHGPIRTKGRTMAKRLDWYYERKG